MTYRVLDHTADTGIDVEATSAAELFAAAAAGMFALMYGDELETQADHEIEIASSGDGYEDLLVNFLSDLLAESEIRRVALVTPTIDHIDEASLRGRLIAVPVDDLGLIGPPVKAVTYHGLYVARVEQRWRARVIFDV